MSAKEVLDGQVVAKVFRTTVARSVNDRTGAGVS
jgi:hypothetical protein